MHAVQLSRLCSNSPELGSPQIGCEFELFPINDNGNCYANSSNACKRYRRCCLATAEVHQQRVSQTAHPLFAAPLLMYMVMSTVPGLLNANHCHYSKLVPKDLPGSHNMPLVTTPRYKQFNLGDKTLHLRASSPYIAHLPWLRQ